MAYYNEVEFEFPLKAEKNVSIIYASNDVGKSCFFKGILFCFYGAERGQNLKDLININAFNQKTYIGYVSVIGQHNDKPIQVTRTITLRGHVSGIPKNSDFIDKLAIWENGNELITENNDEKNDYINAIVHEEAAKYFFFDGEKIEAYNIATAADYKEAITRILGIKEIENARDDFNKIQDDFERERDKILEEQKEASKILEAKKAIENELEVLNKNCEGYENELKNIKSRIVRLEEELKNHDEIKEKIEEKQKLREEEAQLLKDIQQIEKNKIEIFKQNGTIILGCKIADDIRRTLNDFELKHLKAGMSESIKEFLQDLQKQDKCVCGHSMGEKEITKISKYISDKFTNSESMQKELEKRQAFREIDSYVQFAANAKKEYLDSCIEKVKLNKRLNEVQEYLFTLKKQIGNFDEEASERIIKEISILESKQAEIEKRIVEFSTKISMKQVELDEKEKELSKFSSANKRGALAEKKLRLAEKIKNIFNEYLDELTKLKKDEVQQKATEIFLQLTNKANKYKGLIITDDYTLKLELSDGSQYEIVQGRSLNPSTGQSKIISLSYIASINQSSNSVAPVIIDNPVGLFSKEHRMRVMEYLPKFGKQVIFMVTKADLSDEYQAIIEPYVNCKYHLEDRSDTTWNKTIIAEKEVPYE
jgi:DNA sulfur modification protein DndD